MLIDGKVRSIAETEAVLARFGLKLDVAASQYFWRETNVTPGVQVTVGKVR